MRSAAAFLLLLAAAPVAVAQEEVDKYENTIVVSADPAYIPGPGMTPDEFVAFKFLAPSSGQAIIEPPDFEIIDPIGLPLGPLTDPKVDGYRIHWSPVFPTGDLRTWAGLETTFQQDWVGLPKEPGQEEKFVVASDLMPADAPICVSVEFLNSGKWSKLSTIVAAVGSDPGKGCSRTAMDGNLPAPVIGLAYISRDASGALIEYLAADEDNASGGRCAATVVKTYVLENDETDPTTLLQQAEIEAWAASHGTQMAAGVEAPALPTVRQGLRVDASPGSTYVVCVKMTDNGGNAGPVRLAKFSVASSPSDPGTGDSNDGCAGSAAPSGVLALMVMLPLFFLAGFNRQS